MRKFRWKMYMYMKEFFELKHARQRRKKERKKSKYLSRANENNNNKCVHMLSMIIRFRSIVHCVFKSYEN